MRAAEVLRLVSGALQDLEPGMESRWPWEADEGRVGLLDFLNAALRAVALQRPDCCAVTEVIRLEPGARQRLPQRRVHGSSRDATGFCGLVRNMGPDGEQPGPVILPAQPDVLMAWAESCAPGRVVENFAYDRLTNSRVYAVCPPVDDGADVYVEATYYAALRQVVSPDDVLDVADDYAQALVHHMLASVLSGDNESSDAARAAYHMQLFTAQLGAKMQVDSTWPRAARGGQA